MKNFVSITILVIISAILFGATLKGMSGNPDIQTVRAKMEGTTLPLELSPERGRFAHVMSLAINGKYELGQELGQLAYPDVGYIDNRFYSFFAPGIAYMATPFYILGENFGLAQVATFSFISIMTILSMVFMFLICREMLKLPVWASLLAPVVFAFGSSSWSYAVTLYQHHVTVFFIISGIYAVWRFSKGTKWSWAWGILVWANYALSITIDYPNVLLVMPVMVYFLIKAVKLENSNNSFYINIRTSFLVTFIVFALITGFHMYQNSINFGGWLNLAGELPSYKKIVEAELTTEANNLEEHEELNKKSDEKNAIGFFSEERLVRSFKTLVASYDRGIFLYSPILLLGVWGLIKALRDKFSTELGIFLSVILVNLFLYSSWGDPWGGWAFGPRYLIISMSVLSIFTAYWAYSYRAWYAKLLAFILFAYSSGVALLGVLTTNAVPPDVEAGPLGVPPNFLHNWKFFNEGKSSSFIFNEFGSGQLSLLEYSLIIYSVVILFFVILLIMSSNSTKKNEN